MAKMGLLRNMTGFFKYNDVSNRAWQNFIDKGEVSERILRIISFAIIENRKLSERELAIFYAKTSDINQMIVEIKENLLDNAT